MCEVWLGKCTRQPLYNEYLSVSTFPGAVKTPQKRLIPEYDISTSFVKTGSYNEEIAVTTDCLLRPNGTTEIR